MNWTQTHYTRDGQEKRWCATHPTAFWGKNPKTGEYYAKCSYGYKSDEVCVVGNEIVHEPAQEEPQIDGAAIEEEWRDEDAS